MRHDRALYLAILLLAVFATAAAQAVPAASASASEWDDGSASGDLASEWELEAPTPAPPTAPVPRGAINAGEAAELQTELDLRLRSVRDRRARIEPGQRADALARRLLAHEAWLVVVSAGIADVVAGEIRDPEDVAASVERARAAVRATEAVVASR